MSDEKILKFKSDRIVVNHDLAKENLDKEEFEEVFQIVERVNEGLAYQYEMEKLVILGAKAEQNHYMKTRMKPLKILTGIAISLMVLLIAFAIIGTWIPVFSTIAGITSLFINFAMTIFLLYAREKLYNWKSLPFIHKLIWFLAFILNMFLFANGLMDFIGLK